MDARIIQRKLDLIRRAGMVQAWPIGPWQVRTADHLAPAEYRYDGAWTTVAGDASWPAGKTVFVRAQAETPSGIAARDLFIQFEADGLEGLLSINGRPHAGIDVNHTRTTVPEIGSFALEAEFISIPRVLCQPELRGERGRLRQMSFVQVDHEVEAAYYDLSFAWEAARFARDERRRQLLDAALEDALLRIDVTAGRAQLGRDITAARLLLQTRVAAIAPDPEAGRIFLTGHSHIDTAWLWPLRETVRKVGRTFATACRMMERYPNYHFSCSQPQLYRYAQEHYPDLFAQIKKWVRAGRWECTGPMWVEPDCNVPSGESLIRQMMYGVQYFQREFGMRPRTCWLPDVFGYPASLPQILKGCGVENFYTNKLHWQARNPFPHHLFWWEGIDGTRLLAHIPKLRRYYNGGPNPEELGIAWENVRDKTRYAEVLFPFGFGDGGGGPTEDHLEFAARAQGFPSLPAVRQGKEETYFDEVHAAQPALPVWSGELYLETHRGTYTTQGAIKRANRKNELLLRDAEIVSALANIEGAEIETSALHAAWENLLLLQFHDILPGSSIGQVYREAAEDGERIAAAARRVRDDALAALSANVGQAGDVVVFNSLSWARNDVATAMIADAGDQELEVVDAAGRTAPAQVVQRSAGAAQIAFAPGAVPALGYTALTVRPATAPAQHSLQVTPGRMENRYFVVELASNGELTRLFDKRAGREVIAAGQSANRLQLFQDGPEREAAWNVHATFERRAYAWDAETAVTVVESGPVRAAVRVARTYRQSRLEQDIVLYDRLPRIDFVTRADWQERQVMLKAAFPVDVRTPRAAFEVQFGAVERPTHRNTSWDEEKFEVCAHQWADLSETGYGVSLLNDCKYGYDVRDNVLRLTLLRGPEWPDPDADRGRHEFTYALLPHLGDWAAGETVRRAWELNAPLICAPVASGGAASTTTRSFFQIEGPAVASALKRAEDGDGTILRVYEANGGRGRVSVRASFPLRRVVTCTQAEDAIAEAPLQGDAVSFDILPFQIMTFRIW